MRFIENKKRFCQMILAPTGVGKTLMFSIPAVLLIDTKL
jgi:superfamily II DNA/RNA helicase